LVQLHRAPGATDATSTVCDQHIAELTGAELKVLYTIARRTPFTILSYSDLSTLTGLARWSVVKAVRSLVDKKIIIQGKPRAGGAHDSAVYTIRDHGSVGNWQLWSKKVPPKSRMGSISTSLKTVSRKAPDIVHPEPWRNLQHR
jgi:hypothetical protein